MPTHSWEVFTHASEQTGTRHRRQPLYFTRDLSAKGLEKVFSKVAFSLTGKVAVKLHTGEPHGPNIIPRPWVKALLEDCLPGATIVETNTYYEGECDLLSHPA